MDWKIYYSDDSTFSSLDGPVEASEPWGVICIVYPNEGIGRGVMQGFDFYCLVEIDGKPEWHGHDWIGLLDALAARDKIIVVNRGRAIGERHYEELIIRAQEDPDFPRKSGRNKRETPRRI